MNSDTQQKSPLIADKKSVNVLALICALVYFTSYVTRINYGAVVSEIVRAEGIGKEAVSLAVTGLFITYGTGQLISGFLGDRISPKYLMCAGMITVSLMNFLLPLNSNPYYMLAVWCAVSLLGTVVCLCTASSWKRKIYNRICFSGLIKMK